MGTEFPPLEFVIETICHVGGVFVLAGKAKSGKTFLALNLGLSVAGGPPALGRYNVSRGNVLYIAKEHAPSTSKRRVGNILKAYGIAPPPDFQIYSDWPSGEEGGFEAIENWAGDFSNRKLAIVDDQRTFDGVGYSYSKDAKKIQRLGELARRCNIAIITIFHVYKGPAISASSPDWMDKIQGSVGVVGAAHGIMGLARERGTDEGVLRVVGRELPEQNVAMTFNPETGVWLANEGGGEFATVLTEERQRIYLIVRERPGNTATEVAETLGVSYNTVRHLMWSMVQSHQLIRMDGHYYTPEQIEAIEKPDPNPQLAFAEQERVDFIPGELKQANRVTLKTGGLTLTDNVPQHV